MIDQQTEELVMWYLQEKANITKTKEVIPDKVMSVVKSCSEENQVSVSSILGHSRKEKLVKIRRDIWQTLRGEGYPTTEIGKMFNRHHSTIIYGTNSERRLKLKLRNAGY